MSRQVVAAVVILAISAACAGPAVVATPAITSTSVPTSTPQPVWTPAPAITLWTVSGPAALPTNIRECGGMDCAVIVVVRAGYPLVGVCNSEGWCYDAALAGWFWRGCVAGQPGGCGHNAITE